MTASVNTKQEKQRRLTSLACCLSGKKRREEKLVIGIIAAVALVTLVGSVCALYIPDNQVLRFQVMSSRRQDADDDSDLDRGASAPYQNQNDGQRASDGYEDNEPEGPYDETPRDEEGQADLERFFDDHLGASEKDGMDQENLPTDLRPVIVNVVRDLEAAADTSNGDFQTIKLAPSYPGSSSGPSQSYLDNIYSNNQNQQQPQPLESILPNVETSFIKLPNQKLIITRQITRGPVYKGGLDLSHVPAILKYHRENDNESENDNETRNKNAKRGESLDAKGSDVVATENDDMDKIYVTNMTNKPFRIAQLGGYDPEEDFQDASRDFEESERQQRGNRGSTRGKPERGGNENQPAGADSRSGNNDQGLEQQPTRDISFNDEADTLFNDASETDEVFFTQDPYTTDLETELRGEQQAAADQADAIPEQARSAADEEEREERQPEAEASHKRHEKVPKKRGAAKRDDESEGSWVNDGVEDMEVPSQSYQDEVLEKAAAAQEAAAADARRADEGGDGIAGADDQTAQDQEPADQGDRNDYQQDNQEPTQNQDPTNMRMPNADYLKEDMNVDGNDMLR